MSTHERERAALSRNATETEAREPWSRGCCVVVLQNEERPHLPIGYDAYRVPPPFVANLQQGGDEQLAGEWMVWLQNLIFKSALTEWSSRWLDICPA